MSWEWPRGQCELVETHITSNELKSQLATPPRDPAQSWNSIEKMADEARTLKKGSYKVVLKEKEPLVWVVEDAMALKRLDLVDQAVKDHLQMIMLMAFKELMAVQRCAFEHGNEHTRPTTNNRPRADHSLPTCSYGSIK